MAFVRQLQLLVNLELLSNLHFSPKQLLLAVAAAMAAGLGKIPRQVEFEPCKEAKRVSEELAEEESLSCATFLKLWFDQLPFLLGWVVYLLIFLNDGSEAGLNLIVDQSGRLFKKRLNATRKDVIANPRVPGLRFYCVSVFGEQLL